MELGRTFTTHFLFFIRLGWWNLSFILSLGWVAGEATTWRDARKGGLTIDPEPPIATIKAGAEVYAVVVAVYMEPIDSPTPVTDRDAEPLTYSSCRPIPITHQRARYPYIEIEI